MNMVDRAMAAAYPLTKSSCCVPNKEQMARRRRHLNFTPGAKYIFVAAATFGSRYSSEPIQECGQKRTSVLTFLQEIKTQTTTLYLFQARGGAKESFTPVQLWDVIEIREA